MVFLVGCSDEVYLFSNNVVSCPIGAYCDYPSYSNSTTVLNYSDVIGQVVVRYE